MSRSSTSSWYIRSALLIFTGLMFACAFEGCAWMRQRQAQSPLPIPVAPSLYDDVQYNDSALPPVVISNPAVLPNSPGSPSPPSIYIPPIDGSVADSIPVMAENNANNPNILNENNNRLAEEAAAKLAAAEAHIKKLDEENRRLQNELVAKDETVRQHSSAYPKEDTFDYNSPLDDEPEITSAPVPVPEPTPEKLPLAKLQGLRGIEVTQEGRKIRVMIPDAELFLSGTYDFLPSSEDIFKTVMQEVDSEYKGNKLSIEGHTDKLAYGFTENGRPVEIGTEKAFEITTVKAKSTMDRLIANGYAKPERFLNASGYGFGVPLDDTGTDLAREKNRRIEIVVHTDK